MRKCKEQKKAIRNRGCIEEAAGVVEAGNRGYYRGVGKKKMKEDLTVEQLDKCQRKRRIHGEKMVSLKGKIKRGRNGEKRAEWAGSHSVQYVHENQFCPC